MAKSLQLYGPVKSLSVYSRRNYNEKSVPKLSIFKIQRSFVQSLEISK